MPSTTLAERDLPVVIIGAGPIGLAAAAELHLRGMKFVVLEAGAAVGNAIKKWGHVRVFSPWKYLVDSAAATILERSDWQAPNIDDLPLGSEFLTQYLEPLGSSPEIAPHIKFNAEVRNVGRLGYDKVKTDNRENQPFELVLENGERILARAVLDASGTWQQPNPIGSGGIAAEGEVEMRENIHYGIPDIAGGARDTYANVTTMVVGSGHSAMNGLLDLLTLAENEPETKVIWSLRSAPDEKTYGGEENDALPARGLLGKRVREAAQSGALTVLAPFRVLQITKNQYRLHVRGDLDDLEKTIETDQIIAATGFRPNLKMHREIRMDLDPWLEAPTVLAPMIDPNLHSCGSVRPHGADELSHPEKDFYIMGMKSYGRAPTFLMATGYEQARSIVAMLDGDVEASRRVELNLPQTGVCNVSGEFSDSASVEICCGSPAPELTPVAVQEEVCCGGPAPSGVDACCIKDADAKAAGEAGCGCETNSTAPIANVHSSCC